MTANVKFVKVTPGVYSAIPATGEAYAIIKKGSAWVTYRNDGKNVKWVGTDFSFKAAKAGVVSRIVKSNNPLAAWA